MITCFMTKSELKGKKVIPMNFSICLVLKNTHRSQTYGALSIMIPGGQVFVMTTVTCDFSQVNLPYPTEGQIYP
jgi:hypothetical protein